ncbi:MAG: RNA methyltransferase [Deltaproteobacteria bacterium]|jgi:tRNA/rRNA methyltransferase|nr:RNA methyltransferase [Deltaproteobacteria bacterium]
MPQAKEHLLNNIAIVLMKPKYPENIGAAARCAMNMGISHLIVVCDESPDQQKMLKMATHKAAHLIEKMKQVGNLRDALEPFSYVVGTTARQGRKRRIENSPRLMLDTILPLLKNNKVALLFGPENRGLTNDDLKYCQTTVTIPTADFSSLNLAQAVAILCYELYWGIMYSGKKLHSSPKMATSHELEGMYEHVEKLLSRIGFLRTDDSSYWIRNIRNFLGRVGLRAKEARIIRGFCRQFLWYEDQLRKHGVQPAGSDNFDFSLDAEQNGEEKKNSD